MKQKWKKLGSVLLTLCMVLTLLPTVAFAAETSVSITGRTVAECKTEIQNAIDAASSGDTITVTGQVSNAAGQLALVIPAGVTVVWKAILSAASTYDNSLIHLNGEGLFVVAAGGDISASYLALSCDILTQLQINGGKVSTTTGRAISGNVELIDGTVSSVSGTAIQAYGGDTAIVSGGTVSTTTGTAIEGVGNTEVAAITVEGTGTVKATGNFGIAIKSVGKASLQVKDSAIVSAVSGYAISTDDGDTIISGGTVSSGTNCAIYNEGSGDVTVSGGTVSNSATGDTIPVIYMKDKDFLPNIVVSGTGKVLAQGPGGTGTAIRTYSDVTVQDSAQVSATTGYGIYTEGKRSTVTVSGGTVSATTGNAIYAEGASSTVTVSGGAVFAYGNAITGENQVIYQPNVTTGGFTEPTGDGVAIAWNKDAGTTTYIYGAADENGDLTVLPSGATVKWAKQNDQSGISYTNGTNTGFIGVDGVTVSKIGVMIDDQDYQVASDNAHAYSFDLTTLLLNTAVDASQVSAYNCDSFTNNSIFSGTPSISGTTLTLPVAAVAAGLTGTVTIGLTSDMYAIPAVTINVKTVAKTSVTITADMAGGVYNGQPYVYSNAAVTTNTDSSNVTDSVTLEASYEGVDGTAYVPSTTAPTNAGSYQLTLSVPDSDATYIGSAVYPFTIAKRPVTVKADNKSVTVGSDPVFTYTVDGQLSGETALIGEPDLAFAEGNTTKAGSYTINVFLTGVSYTDNYMAADPAYVNGTLTVSNPSSGGDTPSGGGDTTSTGGSSSGGGGGGGSSAPTTSAPTVSGSTATTTVSAQTGTNGTATASVTQSQVTSAIKKAQAAAKSSGEAPNVKIQVSGGSNASAVQTTIPKAAVQAMVSGKMDSLILSGPVAAMTFDAQAIASIAGAASGDVKFSASKVETSTLPDAARQVVGDHPVYNFSVTSGSSTISQFGGTVTVSVPYAPAAGEIPDAIVAYYINADGEPELMQSCHYDAKTGTLVFTTTHFSTYAVGYHKVAFSDVAEGTWCYEAVTFLAARGITGGTTETAFNPNTTLTRGQFITMVMRAYGIEPDNSSADNFSDAGNTYYTGYLAAAKRLGITNGVGGNKFAPKQAVSRQQMFALLYNALKAIGQLPEGDSGKTLSDFTDSASISPYAQEAMASMVKSGAVSGSNGNLKPTATTTRAQMAQVLYNLLSK